MSRLLDGLSRAFAVAGGLVMVAITLVTAYSVVGRWLFGSPVLGDTEIVGFGMAFAVAAFMPLCQWRGENIIVDFFTARSAPATQLRLDRLGALAVGLMLGFVAWRTAAGVVDQRSAGSTTMLMQWPEWWAYAAMVPPLALGAIVGFYTAITGRSGEHAGPPTHNPLPPADPHGDA